MLLSITRFSIVDERDEMAQLVLVRIPRPSDDGFRSTDFESLICKHIRCKSILKPLTMSQSSRAKDIA